MKEDAVAGFLESKFHPSESELVVRAFVEITWDVAAFEIRPKRRQLLEDLPYGQSQRLHLLLFHPDDVGLITSGNNQPETTLTGNSQRFGPESLDIVHDIR